MAGHSKWANIKHKKGKADAARGKIFSKMAKEITVSARCGGGDPDANITLRALIQKAKAANMPNDNIDRAVKKGTGELEGGQLDEIVYEGYATGGVGLIIKVLTDNKNRSATDVRTIFKKAGANMASTGAVSHMFQRKGQILVDAAGKDEDAIMELALEAGAEDFVNNGDQFEIITDPSDFVAVSESLTAAGIEMDAESAVTMLPDAPTQITDKAQAEKVLEFVDALEENDDVQDVYCGFEIDDAIMEELAAE
jgi:YebC/PmpR family DNA-binding regulatory protein